MSFKNFQQYLVERKKHSHGIVSDNKGFANRDYDGDLSLKPKPGQSLLPNEYYAPKAEKNPGLMTADGKDRGKPLGDLATPGITPKNATTSGEKPVDKTKKMGSSKKKLPTKKAMKNEQFLNKTRKMSDAEFTKHMIEHSEKIPSVTLRDLYGKEFTPEPAQTMKYVVGLMMTNENMMRRMVRELKRNGAFQQLIAEVLAQPETYHCLNEAARGNYGKDAERKVLAFFEGVSPPRVGAASAGAPGGGGQLAGNPIQGAPGSVGGGGVQGGAFGGGSGPMTNPPAAGISGGTNNGGGFNIRGGATGGNGMGMGEEEMGMSMGDDENPMGMGGEEDEHPHNFDFGDGEEGDDEGRDSEDDDDEDEENDDLGDDEDNEDDEEDDDDEFGHHEEEPQGMGMGGGGNNFFSR